MIAKFRTMRHSSQAGGLEDLIRHINGISPTKSMSLIEIGAYTGESTSIFCRHFASVVTVDPFLDNYDPKDSACRHAPMSEVYAEFRKRMSKHENYRLIKKKSDEAIKDLSAAKFDVLYVDGMHQYEQVTRDILNFSDLIKVGGFIAGHDYCDGWSGVVKAVNECCGKPEKVFRDTSWIIRKTG